MPLMEWTDKLSVGVPSIDAQHKKLVSMANTLYDAMKAGHGKEILDETLAGLINYTVTHFKYEEKLFAQTGYPASRSAHEAARGPDETGSGDPGEDEKGGELRSIHGSHGVPEELADQPYFGLRQGIRAVPDLKRRQVAFRPIAVSANLVRPRTHGHRDYLEPHFLSKRLVHKLPSPPRAILRGGRVPLNCPAIVLTPLVRGREFC